MPELTHLDARGAMKMVDIGDKPETSRFARARAVLRLAPETLRALSENRIAKGDALAVVRLAALAAAKNNAALIPLCHPIRLTAVDVEIELLESPPQVVITTLVRAQDRTGPEMEAMAAATVGALALYDMCKAIDRDMEITTVELLEKGGGKSGHWRKHSERG